MIPTLPLRLRNRLAATILDAIHDEAARRELASLVRGCEGGVPPGWFGSDEQGYADILCARARRAHGVLASRALGARNAPLDEALDVARAFFDAGLYFEVHELLEPYWGVAPGGEREALQGLIQVAVGYQHLANGNVAGAEALLREGSDRLRGRRVGVLELDAFSRDVSALVARLGAPEGMLVPRFPRPLSATKHEE